MLRSSSGFKKQEVFTGVRLLFVFLSVYRCMACWLILLLVASDHERLPGVLQLPGSETAIFPGREQQLARSIQVHRANRTLRSFGEAGVTGLAVIKRGHIWQKQPSSHGPRKPLTSSSLTLAICRPLDLHERQLH